MSMRFWVYVGLGVLACRSIASAAEVDVRLAEAAKREDRSAIRTLIDQKADVNAPLADGSTALHWAVQADDVESVNLLLQAGANVKAANRYGVTPLHLATSNGNAAIINRYHVSMLAYFLEKLKSTPDGDGTLLDHSMVLYGSSMSNGNQHDHDPLPVILAGGASGQLEGGRHVKLAASIRRSTATARACSTSRRLSALVSRLS